MNAVGIVFSNIHDNNVPELTRQRTMASIPFGGRYRLIDFALSNMVNSKITKVGVITKNNYQSLMDHVGSGKDWDLARKNGGLILLPPFGASGNNGLYNTRLEALKGVMSFLWRSNEEYVILTDCDNVCKMDFDKILDYHEENNADMTLVYKEMNGFEIDSDERITFQTDEDERISDVKMNVKVIDKAKVYLNIMIMKKNLLQNIVLDAISHGQHHFGEILISSVKSHKMLGYKFEGFFGFINSLSGYYRTNLKLLDKDLRQELFGDRGIYTKVRDSAPTKYGQSATVRNSFIADGCNIEGEVENSILFRGVKVDRGTIVKNSILMQDTVTGENVNLNAVITDKNVVIRDRRVLSGCESQPFFIGKGMMV